MKKVIWKCDHLKCYIHGVKLIKIELLCINPGGKSRPQKSDFVFQYQTNLFLNLISPTAGHDGLFRLRNFTHESPTILTFICFVFIYLCD